jgi:hypothetical protein
MVFSLVESPFEEDMRNDIYNARNLFKADATCVSGNAFKYCTAMGMLKSKIVNVS